jgi:hypothetical protein
MIQALHGHTFCPLLPHLRCPLCPASCPLCLWKNLLLLGILDIAEQLCKGIFS